MPSSLVQDPHSRQQAGAGVVPQPGWALSGPTATMSLLQGAAGRPSACLALFWHMKASALIGTRVHPGGGDQAVNELCSARSLLAKS